MSPKAVSFYYVRLNILKCPHCGYSKAELWESKWERDIKREIKCKSCGGFPL